MKKLIGLAFVAMIVSFAACAQKNVPAKAKDAFNQKFPNAQNVNWGKEGSNVWEAEFKMNGKEMSANYDPDGNWKETEEEIQENEVPEVVNNALQTNYPDATISHVFKVENTEGISYEYEIKNNGNKMEVVLDSSGNIKKSEPNDEEDDED